MSSSPSLGPGGERRARAPTASSAARAAIARLLATVSRQPNRPQRQAAPSSTTATWPISPAPKPSPWNREPLRTRPAPIPRPTLIVMRFGIRAALGPERVLGQGRCLAVVRDVGRQAIPLVEEAAERQVLPVQVDCPSDRAGPRVDETRRPDADSEGSRGGFGEQLVDEAGRRASSAASPLRPSTGSSTTRRTSPRRLTRAPENVLSPRSRPMTCRASPTMLRRIGLLPPVDGPRPTSSTMPSSSSSPTTSPTVVRVRPVLRATSARLIGPKS